MAEDAEIGIPSESLHHPVVIGVGVLVVALALLRWAVPSARATVVPAWRWVTGRDTRAYGQLLGEVELLRTQLEESREERRQADERHSREIAAMRAQYEEDMTFIREELMETRRQLLMATVGKEV